MAKRGLQKLIIFLIVLVLIIPVITLWMDFEGQYTSEKDIIENLSSSNALPSVDDLSLPEIDYDSLNDAWINQKVEMLIITPNDSQFIEAVEPLKEWRDSIGVKTQILSNFSEYDGVDTQEKIRNMIKDFYKEIMKLLEVIYTNRLIIIMQI